MALEESEQTACPVITDWRLNERHYGALQGKDKKETVAEFGEAQVKVWRRSYDVPPPPVEAGSKYDAKVRLGHADADLSRRCSESGSERESGPPSLTYLRWAAHTLTPRTHHRSTRCTRASTPPCCPSASASRTRWSAACRCGMNRSHRHPARADGTAHARLLSSRRTCT